MLYQIFVEYDGCSNGPAVFTGKKMACYQYMLTHKPPRLCQWNLVSCTSGRSVSYVL
jgi:hypothetical protein